MFSIFISRIFMVLGLLWVMLAMILQILSRVAFGLEKDNLKPAVLFIILQGISLIVTNSVYLAVIINHSTQCEMIMFYVDEVRTRLEEKSIPLKDAMQVCLFECVLNFIQKTVNLYFFEYSKYSI
jgi:hypothetical protein